MATGTLPSPGVHTTFISSWYWLNAPSLSSLRSGKPLQLTLQACDVKGKEEKSGPENLLVEPWTRDGEWWICLFAVNEKDHSEVTNQLCEIARWTEIFRICRHHVRLPFGLTVVPEPLVWFLYCSTVICWVSVACKQSIWEPLESKESFSWNIKCYLFKVQIIMLS